MMNSKKYILFAASTIAATTFANAEQVCNMHTITSSATSAIVERGKVEATVTNNKCFVSFRARIGNDWHVAMGDSEWDGNSSPHNSCQRAIRNAESNLLQQFSNVEIFSENIMICTDSTLATNPLPNGVGETGTRDQFRTHPDFPGTFWHNRTPCFWSLTNQVVDKQVVALNQVVCYIGENKWIIVDQF